MSEFPRVYFKKHLYNPYSCMGVGGEGSEGVRFRGFILKFNAFSHFYLKIQCTLNLN